MPVLAGCAACLAFVGVFNYSTCLYNSTHNGYFGLSLPDSREYRNFYMALQSVGEPTGYKYYPVDQDRLDLVAQAGPASHWFVEQMGTDLNFRKISQSKFGRYDLALAWFHFVVFFNTIPDGNFQRGFAMFKDVENEITKAGKEKRLKVRSIIPLPDCRITIVLSALPEALRHLAVLTTTIPDRYAWASGSDEPQFVNADFTQALTRRTVSPSPLRENIGRSFCAVYAVIYGPMFLGLGLVVAAYGASLSFRRRQNLGPSPSFLAQQLFGICFVTFYLWYVLFDASGVAATPRLAVFQNVLLPLLFVYYLRQTWKVIRAGSFPDKHERRSAKERSA